MLTMKSFMKLAVRIPNIGLQFSVHESTDEARNNLIPFKKKLNIEGIARVGNKFFEMTGRNPFFNYCAHSTNNKDENAQSLQKIFNPSVWQATVSIICESNNGMPSTSCAQKEIANDFASKLVTKGFDVRVFDPAGQDTIGGGCGQLWHVQKWMKENKKYVKHTT